MAGSRFGGGLWANIVAVEGDVLPGERRDVCKQIIADNLTLGTPGELRRVCDCNNYYWIVSYARLL